jgi:Conserved TM helix
MAPVTNLAEALTTAFASALAIFLGAIPKVIGFVVILIIGWLIASAIASVVATLLRTVKFNDLAKRSGFSGFVEKMGIKKDASGFLAEIARWFVRLIVLVTAFDALGLPAVSQVLEQFLLWLPNLVVALVILVLAGLAAKALAGLVRGGASEVGFGNADVLANIARIAVWAFAIVIAVNQIGVATTLVNTLFMGLVGALALALGLAFGLGGRETAAEMWKTWHQKGQEAAPRLAEAADAAPEQATPSNGRAPARPVVADPPRPQG